MLLYLLRTMPCFQANLPPGYFSFNMSLLDLNRCIVRAFSRKKFLGHLENCIKALSWFYSIPAWLLHACYYVTTAP
jgi:hypothetical protein